MWGSLGRGPPPARAGSCRRPSQPCSAPHLAHGVRGYRSPAGGRLVRAKPVIAPSAGPEATLSFVNLMEALTLSGFRQIRVPMQRVRKALEDAARFGDA